MSTESDPATDPGAFLRKVAAAGPGWSASFGGPVGVARLTVELQAAVSAQAQALAALRTAAIQELLTTTSLADVARDLGVSKQAVSKAAHGLTWADPKW